MIYGIVGRIVVWAGVSVAGAYGVAFLYIWVRLLIDRCSGGC